MGVFDQAARMAAQADPTVVPLRLLVDSGLTLSFREWLDTRMLPLPGARDRTADLVAALDDRAAVDKPWLLLIEFQAQVDADKLDVTLEEAATLRSRVRHGEDRRGKYNVTAGLVNLQGSCPATELDMTLPNGRGTRHAPLFWNVADDDAAQVLEAVAAKVLSWGMLFWVCLMAGGGEEGLISHWRDVVQDRVEDRRTRGTLAGIALVFAELAGRVLAWERGLEGFDVTESQVVNNWISQGEARGKVSDRRESLLELLEGRFPGEVSEEVIRLIQEQESMNLLKDWFAAAVRVATFDKFLEGLRR